MKCINGPMYYIENNWEDSLSKVGDEIWITFKHKEKSGKHGKVVRINNTDGSRTSAVSATDGFIVNLLTHNAIQVTLTDSTFSNIFVAPRSVYSNIHGKSVTSLDVSEESSCVSVSAENETNIVVWLTDCQAKTRTFTEHVGTVYKCRWFPNGKVILSFGADMNLKIWCSETGRCPVSLKGHTRAITDVAFIDRGRNIISVSKDGYCKLWDCGEARCLANLICLPFSINCCSISVVPENISLPETDLLVDEREIGTDDKILLLGTEDGNTHCLAVRSRKILFSLKLDSAINCSCCIKAGLFAVGCHNGNVYLITAAENEPIIISWFETNSPALCALSYKGKGFFIGYNDGSCVYRIVSDYNYPVRLSLTGSNGDSIYDVCCDNKFVYTACRDSNVRKYSPDPYICRHFDC